jgi:hypothetical protein
MYQKKGNSMMNPLINNYWLVSLFILVLTVQAQPDQLLEKYKPVTELSVQVTAMLELEQTTELSFSKEQAVTLLPILTYLQTTDTLTNEEASSYKQQLDERILTPRQRDWVSEKASELSAIMFAADNRPPGGMGIAIKLMRGEPVNLVKEGPSKDALTELIELLKSKTN